MARPVGQRIHDLIDEDSRDRTAEHIGAKRAEEYRHERQTLGDPIGKEVMRRIDAGEDVGAVLKWQVETLVRAEEDLALRYGLIDEETVRSRRKCQDESCSNDRPGHTLHVCRFHGALYSHSCRECGQGLPPTKGNIVDRIVKAAIEASLSSGEPAVLKWNEELSNSIVCDSWSALGFHHSVFRGCEGGRRWEIHLVPTKES